MSMLRFEGIRRRGLVAAAALGLLAAACGGDSEGNIVLDTSTSISPDDAASPSTTIAGDDSGSDAGEVLTVGLLNRGGEIRLGLQEDVPNRGPRRWNRHR